MNDEWAIRVLDTWVQLAKQAMTNGFTTGPSTGPIVDEMRAREYQTREVVARVLGSTTFPEIIHRTANRSLADYASGLATVQLALGRLKTAAESRANLGSTAPAMAADGLHPIIWDAAETLWSDGHHGQAVQRAATFLNAHVQDLTDRHDVSDVVLMNQAFSPNNPEPGKPRLRWPGDDADLTVRAMRSGILNFSQGCFSAIRNPATHRTEDLPIQVALEHLATLSTLARWIDGCEIVSA